MRCLGIRPNHFQQYILISVDIVIIYNLTMLKGDTLGVEGTLNICRMNLPDPYQVWPIKQKKVSLLVSSISNLIKSEIQVDGK